MKKELVLLEIKNGRIIMIGSTSANIEFKILDHDLDYEHAAFQESPHDTWEIDLLMTPKEITEHITNASNITH